MNFFGPQACVAAKELPRILIVTDQSFVSDSVHAAIADSGYSIAAVAPDEDAAHKLLASSNFDAVLLQGDLMCDYADLADDLIGQGIPFAVLDAPRGQNRWLS
jgi:DNA-binding NarL/FixJ family response regulator